MVHSNWNQLAGMSEGFIDGFRKYIYLSHLPSLCLSTSVPLIMYLVKEGMILCFWYAFSCICRFFGGSLELACPERWFENIVLAVEDISGFLCRRNTENSFGGHQSGSVS